MKNKISIIVPTYNEKETIISFLEKITYQISKHNFNAEIIIVDDGSPDGTAKLIGNFMKTHPILFYSTDTKNGVGVRLYLRFRSCKQPYAGSHGF